LRATVGRLVANGQCESAKNMALQSGELDLAEQAMRLCKPNTPSSEPVELITGAVSPAGSGGLRRVDTPLARTAPKNFTPRTFGPPVTIAPPPSAAAAGR
jgi:hypothetical protein